MQVTLARSIPLLLALGACDCGSSPTPARCDVTTPCEDATLVCLDGACVPPSDASLTDAAPSDAPLPDVGGEDAGPCRVVEGESTLEPSPVDIVVVIDNSGSMTQEAEQTRANMNRFAEILGESGLDYRVVLISAPDGDTGVCIPAPLGSGEPDCGSGPEGRLRAIHQEVGSRDAMEQMLARYDDYVDFLRPGAVKVFVWITDDESRDLTPDSFRAALAALEPAGMFEQTIHNAIVGFYGDTPETWTSAGAGECDSLRRVGERYLGLAACLTDAGEPVEGCTPGLTARVCELDWSTIFEVIAEGVVRGVPVRCDFALPEPPDDMTLNLDEVTVTYTHGDMTDESLTRAASMDECADGRWYFDDPAMPTTVLLCPELCTRVQRDEGARLNVGLGCFPVLE